MIDEELKNKRETNYFDKCKSSFCLDESYNMTYGYSEGYRDGYFDAMGYFFSPKCIREVINYYFNWIDQQLDDKAEKSSILKEFMEKQSKIVSENEDNSETNKLITDLFDEYLVKFIKENLYKEI